MSLFTYNSTHAEVVAERDQLKDYVAAYKQKLDAKKSELTKEKKNVSELREESLKLNRSVEQWKMSAFKMHAAVKKFASDVTGEEIKDYNQSLSANVSEILCETLTHVVNEKGEARNKNEALAKKNEVLTRKIENMKEEKRSLKEEIMGLQTVVEKLKKENEAVNTRFDCLTAMASENFAARYSNFLRNGTKKRRLTLLENEEDVGETSPTHQRFQESGL